MAILRRVKREVWLSNIGNNGVLSDQHFALYICPKGLGELMPATYAGMIPAQAFDERYRQHASGHVENFDAEIVIILDAEVYLNLTTRK
jgi:hypothetical protein